MGPTPRIFGRPISALRAGEIRRFVATCDVELWLRAALEWELQSARPRRTVIKALNARLLEVTMPRRMSCSMTIEPVRDRTKTVTRRHVDTWADLKPGDPLTLIEKGMGLPKGAKQVVLAEVEVVSVRVERLVSGVSELEVEREGLGGMTPEEFCQFWMESHGYGGWGSDQTLHEVEAIECRRIEWRYPDAER